MEKKYNLKIKTGAHYRLLLRWYKSNGSPKILTDYDAKMALKSTYASPITILELTLNNGIYITPEEGKIEILITDEQTKSIGKPRETSGVYDLKIIQPDGYVVRLIEGIWTMYPSVTD